jgi:hypothetical protein
VLLAEEEEKTIVRRKKMEMGESKKGQHVLHDDPCIV